MNRRAELGAKMEDWPQMGCIFPVYLLKAFLAIHLPGGNSFLALRSHACGMDEECGRDGEWGPCGLLKDFQCFIPPSIYALCTELEIR